MLVPVAPSLSGRSNLRFNPKYFPELLAGVPVQQLVGPFERAVAQLPTAAHSLVRDLFFDGDKQ